MRCLFLLANKLVEQINANAAYTAYAVTQPDGNPAIVVSGADATFGEGVVLD
jgi:hypothetical protein